MAQHSVPYTKSQVCVCVSGLTYFCLSGHPTGRLVGRKSNELRQQGLGFDVGITL